MVEGSEIQRELERDVEVSTGIAKSSLRKGKQKKEKKSLKKKNVLSVAVEGCIPGREAESCPGAAQPSVRDGKISHHPLHLVTYKCCLLFPTI